jgi:hypothetical protein
MELEDFELQLGPRSGPDLEVRVLRSPAGEGEGRMPFPEALAGGWHPLQGDPAAAGGLLFRSLFRGQVGELLHASLRGDGERSGLRLRLRINPRHPGLAPLHRIPWELLYRESTEDFLALSRRTPVVRAFDLPRPAAVQPFEPPLRLLVVRCQPPGSTYLDLDSELEELRAWLTPHPSLELAVLDDPDPQSLRRFLLDTPVHVLHYMGHGAFNPETGAGALLYRGRRGAAPLYGRHLATKLKDLGSLRLVVLNACDTALAGVEGGQSPFAGVATALVLGGLPAVVAMQSPIEDRSAIAFSAAFYDRLARGMTVEAALTEGRQAIHSLDPEGAAWAVPVLFLRTPSGALFEIERTSQQALAAPAAPAAQTPAALVEAPAPPAAPGRSRRQRLVLGTGTAGLAAALAVALGEIARQPERWLGQGDPPAVTEAAAEAAAEPSPAPSEPEQRSTPAQPKAPAPARVSPPRSTRTVTVGEGEAAWRFRISADSRVLDDFAAALEDAAGPLPGLGGLGQSVSVDIPSPRIESSTEAGLTSAACSLSATCRSPAGTFTIPVKRAQGEEIGACRVAAEALAGAVADRLAHSL